MKKLAGVRFEHFVPNAIFPKRRKKRGEFVFFFLNAELLDVFSPLDHVPMDPRVHRTTDFLIDLRQRP